MLPSLYDNEGKAPKVENAPAKKESTAVELQPNEVALKIQTSLQKAESNWPVIKERSVKAQAALSKVLKIETDEEDEAAETIVKKATKTYKEISDLRLEITAPLDEIKEKVMEPEKKISNLKGHEGVSELARVIKLRNGYATLKLQKKREEEAAAKSEEDSKFEESRLKAELQTKFTNNVTDYAATAEIAMANFFNSLQLEKENPEDAEKPITWDDQIKKFNMTPKLKEATFNTWFEIPYDKTKLSTEKYEAFIVWVKSVYTYALINEAYVKIAQPKVDEYKGKLPAKKKELEDLARLAAKDKKAAETLRLKQEKEAKEKVEKITADANLEKEKNAKDIKKQQNNENLGASFETLKVTQNQDNSDKIKRIPIVVATEPQEIFDAMAVALFHFFKQPDFEGIFKKDKATGFNLEPDANGMPVYTPWAKTILEAIAEDPTIQIEGISFKEIAVAKTSRDKKSTAE